jgi:hypothetical protein
MKTLKKPKFYANLDDETHCTQASIIMVLSILFPEKNFSFEEIDKVTNNQWSGFATWQTHELFYYEELNINFKYYDTFDMKIFGEQGLAYIAEAYGHEVAEYNLKNTKDINLERRLCLEIANKKWFFKRKNIGLNLVKKLLDQNYYLMLNLNSRILNQQPGWAGHRVVCYGYDENGLVVHDPGLPPHPARHVAFDLFKKAWDDKAIIAIKA